MPRPTGAASVRVGRSRSPRITRLGTLSACVGRNIVAEGAGQPSDLIGRVLDGRYRIDALLGEGGLGQVFRAFDRRLGRSVAIKVMHPEHVARSELRARFEREARS